MNPETCPAEELQQPTDSTSDFSLFMVGMGIAFVAGLIVATAVTLAATGQFS